MKFWLALFPFLHFAIPTGRRSGEGKEFAPPLRWHRLEELLPLLRGELREKRSCFLRRKLEDDVGKQFRWKLPEDFNGGEKGNGYGR